MTNTPLHVRFPQGRTAFLLIHGIGEQSPFETLDYFAQNFVRYFEQQKVHIQLEHLMAKRRLSTGALWTESFVRLSPSDLTQDWFIDIHEYYWAPETENKITVPEVLQWAEQTLDGTIDFYGRKDNQYLLEQLLQHRSSKSLFKFRLRSLTIFLRLFNLFYPVLRLGTWLILSLLGPFFKGNFLGSAWKLSKAIVTPALVNFIGDIAIYTKTNPRSAYFKIRQRVVTESLTLLQEILQDQQADYNQVILAGHSLGSCIAYDTLNQLCIEASLAPDQGKSMLIDKLNGLVTFGSPLDKIAFFFQETARENQYIRKRILEHLNSFRVKPKSTTELVQKSQYFSCSPVVCQLNQLRWFNYYHQKDPISGSLDYYENLDNIEMEYQASWGSQGHLGYWNDLKFYEHMANQFLYTPNQH
ncbi:MAG: hypothetical protein KME23_13120 [Goleter apudmare HA4340-LM2]|jgi:hypothetical protein|nr:hypothetical protein [Goleter apudmare HA4340-LM2]